jgi:hypothetical protein
MASRRTRMSGDVSADHHGRRAAQRAARYGLVALVAVFALTVIALPAGAAGGDGRRGAEELRQAYPLNPEESSSGAGRAGGEATVANDAPEGAVNSRLMLQLGMVVAVIYAAFVCVWFMAFRPRRRSVALPGAHAEAVWTCAIGWRPGRVRSRFRAFVELPGGRGRRVVAQSRRIHWPPRRGENVATAEVVSALESLVAALVAAGWEPVESSGSWSARRFVWRHGGKPPGRLRLVQWQ